MQEINRIHSQLRTWARKLGPYVVLEILLPGGTLLALLLFLYRRGRLLQTAQPWTVAMAATAGRLTQESPAMSNWRLPVRPVCRCPLNRNP